MRIKKIGGTVTRNFEIEQSSEIIFKDKLPKNWLFRKQNPDFHIDYDVEIVENSGLTGIVFGVQLKGTEHLEVHNNKIKFTMFTKQLDYYLNKVKTKPMFLILVDILNKNIYWLFLQKYLKEDVKNKNWKNQKRLTISISKRNVLNDVEVFKNEVIAANNYIKELWPSTVRASVNKEKEQFNKLDPRFDVEIIAKGENVSYKFHTDEKLDIKFQIKDQKILEKIFSEPNDGRTIKVPREVIEVTGSDLLKDRLSVSDYIEFKLLPPSLKADVYLSRLGGEHNQAELVHLTSKLSFQKEFLKIQSWLIDAPLKIECIFYFAINSKPSFNINFDFTNWINKPIKFLPYADKLFNLFTSHKENETIIYKAEVNGERLLDGTFKTWDNIDFNNYTNSVLTLYSRLKYLDTHYNLNLIFPDLTKLKKVDYNDVEELYSLLTKKEYIVKNKKLSLNFKIKNDKKFLEPYVKGADIRLVTNFDFNILGNKILVENMAVDISSPRMKPNAKEFEKLINTKEEYIPLSFTTDKNSKVFYRLLDKK